jgi:hypothetical protein
MAKRKVRAPEKTLRWLTTTSPPPPTAIRIRTREPHSGRDHGAQRKEFGIEYYDERDVRQASCT